MSSDGYWVKNIDETWTISEGQEECSCPTNDWVSFNYKNSVRLGLGGNITLNKPKDICIYDDFTTTMKKGGIPGLPHSSKTCTDILETCDLINDELVEAFSSIEVDDKIDLPVVDIRTRLKLSELEFSHNMKKRIENFTYELSEPQAGKDICKFQGIDIKDNPECKKYHSNICWVETYHLAHDVVIDEESCDDILDDDVKQDNIHCDYTAKRGKEHLPVTSMYIGYL